MKCPKSISLDNHDSKDSSLLHQNSVTRLKHRPAKRKLESIPTSNILQSITTPTVSTSTVCAENILGLSIVPQIHLDEPCNLLTKLHCPPKESLSLTPITDIRYEIVDMFTKGTNAQSNITPSICTPQISPLPSIASLMNRHSSQGSPAVSPAKQTIGINTEPLTTSTTNILHQTITTS